MPLKYNKGAGVYKTETDLSQVSEPVGTSTGAFVGKAPQGPVNRRVLVQRDQDFVTTFGKPSENYGYGAYGILEFLKNSSNAYFVRVTSGTEGYAHVSFTTSGSAAWKTLYATATTDLLAANGYEDGNKPDDIREINNYSFSGELFAVASIGPGTYGNNLAVSIVTSADAISAGFDWKYKYDSNPDTDLDPIYKKVFRINVFKKETNALGFNAVSGAPVETFYVSREQVKDANQNSLYMHDVINGVSKYIYVRNNVSVADTTRVASSPLTPLLSGTDNYTIPVGSVYSGWSLFQDREKVDAQIFVCTDPGDLNSSNYTIQQTVGNIAAARMDAIAVMQVDGTSASVTNPTTIVTNAGYGYNNPSYSALYAGWERVYDQYNNRETYLPLNIFAASVFARVDATSNVWNAPAGPNRGRISTLGSNVVWSGTQIGTFRDNNINVVKSAPGSGKFLIAQRTAQRKNTALSNIHVRRTLNFIESTIEKSLEPFIFEPNNANTRLRVRNILSGFLDTVAAGGGLNTDRDAGYLIVCDETNNTPDRIDNGELIVDIFVKIQQVVEFVQLNTIVVNGSFSFSEVVG